MSIKLYFETEYEMAGLNHRVGICEQGLKKIEGGFNIDKSVLKIGTTDRGYVDDIDVVIQYVEYLEEFELVSFCNNYRNGAIRLLQDSKGNNLVCIVIGLNIGDTVYAETLLNFRKFQERKGR